MNRYMNRNTLDFTLSQSDVYYIHEIPVAIISQVRKDYLDRLTLQELGQWVWYLHHCSMTEYQIATRLNCSREFIREKLLELNNVEERPKQIPDIIEVREREPRYIRSPENTIEYLTIAIEEFTQKLIEKEEANGNTTRG